MKPTSVLFVCTGNICRSPTAHAVFRHQVREAGLEAYFTIDSAGTHGYHIGDAPDDRSILVAAAKGVKMQDLRARKVTQEDFASFDYILAMDEGHFKTLQTLQGRGDKAKLLMFAAGNVPDPYYGSLADFEHVFDMIEKNCRRWLATLGA